MTAAVFQVLRADDQVVGAGFLVDEGAAFTCAHVVNAARQEPGGWLELVFPGLPGAPRVRAQVLADTWKTPEAQDVAVLRLAEVPAQARGLRVGTGAGSQGHKVFSFGFPAQAPGSGHFGYGTVAGLLDDGSDAGQLLQLRQANDLTSGFSGAPVVDAVTDLVVGMVTSIAGFDPHSRGLGIAYATPAEVLRDAWPQLAEHQTCPYVGLEPFTAQHKAWFHGREAAAEKVLDVFLSNRRALMLLGPSGAGKSSLVNAGLLPALAEGAVPGSDRWLVVHARPGRDLLAELDTAGLLGAAHGDLPAAAAARLATEPDHDRVLLVIDQFEELLTQQTSIPDTNREATDGARLRAINQLLALVHSPVDAMVLLIVRNDFYAPLEALAPALMEQFFPGACNIPAVLSRRELMEIVTQPAEAVGLRLEAGLAARIVDDVIKADPSGQQGSAILLPALQLALRQLWVRRRAEDGQLTHAAYDRIGGVTGSMTVWCNQALAQLPPIQHPIARQILTSLVRPADQERGIPAARQLVPLTRLRSLATGSVSSGTNPEYVFNGVLAALTRYRIIATSTTGDVNTYPGEATAELVHDALLRDWADLRDWVAQDQQFQLWLQRAAEQQARHDRSGMTGDLLDGSLLAEGAEWEASRSLPPEIAALLHQSKQYQQANLRRTRRLNTVLAGLLGLALIATGIAFYQQHAATSAQHQAQSRQLAAESTVLADSDPDLASLLAVKAWKISPTEEAREALYAAPATPLLRLFKGHTAAVESVAFSPDGRLIATGSGDHTVRLWDTHSGKLRHTLRGHTDDVTSVAFSPDGRTLATGGDQTVRLWDTHSGKLREIQRGSTAAVSALAFSPDGSTLAIAIHYGDSGIVLWDVRSGKPRITFKSRTAETVSSVSFSPDGKTLATASHDDNVRLWDTSSGKLRHTLKGHTAWVESVVFSPDGKTLATASDDKTVRFWDTESGKLGTTLQGSDAVSSVAFSPDGETLAVGVYNGTVRLLDARSAEVRATYKVSNKAVQSVVFSPDGKTLATASDDMTARLWDTQSRNPQSTLRTGSITLSSVVFSHDSKLLAAGGAYPGYVYLWDARLGKLLNTVRANNVAVNSVAFSPDGKTLATTGTLDGVVRLWDARFGKLRISLESNNLGGKSVTFSPDGKTVAMGGGFSEGGVRLWDAKSGKLLNTLKVNNKEVDSVSFSPDGETLATASSDHTARLWDVPSGHLEHTLKGHVNAVTSVAFSPDGKSLATASSDHTARLWDVPSGKLRTVLKGHTEDVTSVAFSPDGKELATGSRDRTVRLWDSQSANLRTTLTGNNEPVSSVVFSPDGKTVAAATADGLVNVWSQEQRDENQIARSICTVITRNFTMDEKTQYLHDKDSTPVC